MAREGVLGAWSRLNLVTRIVIGLVLAVVVALVTRHFGGGAEGWDAVIERTGALPTGWPSDVMAGAVLLGDLFVGALKAVAPVLVLVLVMAAIAQHEHGTETNIRPILVLYLVGTFAAALVAVAASFMFPSNLSLEGVKHATEVAPGGIGMVLKDVLMKLVSNPIKALLEANYIGILGWGVLLGLSFRHASEHTRTMLNDAAEAVSKVVRFVIGFAPLGILGLLLATLLSPDGFTKLQQYLHLLLVLVGAMLFVALVVNPLIVFSQTRRNPYPLVFTCLLESGIPAFFTRSSAANIPVNMALAKKLNLHEDTYSISIPLGATINMAGAAITITVLTLAAVNTMGIQVDFATALLLSVVATLGACGASGVAGGSLLLIPMACALFSIDNDVAMQVAGVGFIISVIQDSSETALNSSTDVLFTAAVDQAHKA